MDANPANMSKNKMASPWTAVSVFQTARDLPNGTRNIGKASAPTSVSEMARLMIK